jgi:hypothetical protein
MFSAVADSQLLELRHILPLIAGWHRPQATQTAQLLISYLFRQL